MRELGHLTRMTDSHVSRLVRGLALQGQFNALPPCRGLLEIRASVGDRRSRTLHLSHSGRLLRDALEERNARAIPIVDEAMKGVAS